MVLGVCLPIPLFAATGLSLPLPASVERLAASLVPWADETIVDGAQAFSLGENGSIVLAPGESPTTASSGFDTASSGAGPDSDGQAKEGRNRPAGTATGQPQDGGDGSSATQGGGGSGGSDPGTSDPTTGPVQGAVEGVIGATEPVVDAVEGATGATGAGDILDDVAGAAEDTAGAVDGIVGGIGG